MDGSFDAAPEAPVAADADVGPAMIGGGRRDAAAESPGDAGHDGAADGSRAQTDPTPRMRGAEVFSPTEILVFRVSLPASDARRLEERGNEEVYVPASVRVTGSEVLASFDRVGFRHKGAWTLHQCFDGGTRSYEDECAKLSYKLKFSEYDADARLHGLKRLNLHAMSVDDSKLREQLAYDLFNAFGVDAPRTGYARLFINDEPMGLFAVVEEVDGRYTAFHYPDGGDGNLYKEVWPRAGLEDVHFLEHLETNDDPEDNPNVSDMQGFSAAVGRSTEATFEANMADWIDLDQILRYMAVDRAIRNWDGVVTFYAPETPHNFYWYHEEPPQGLFRLIPWDLDNTFWSFDPIMHPDQGGLSAAPIPDWNVKPRDCRRRSLWEAGGGTRVAPPGCDPFLNLLARTGWERFVELGRELLAGPLQRATLEAKLDHWQALIDQAVREDPYVSYDAWRQEVSALRAALPGIISDFEAHLREGYIAE